ncbi:MAG: hypothetical protein ACTSRG_01820 [Candidatus Helarchaeota archaeon]
MESLKEMRKNKTLHKDLIILIIGMMGVIAGIVIASVAGKYLVYNSYYQQNNHTKYKVTGPLAYKLDGVPLTFIDIYTAGMGPVGIVAVITGYKQVDVFTVLTESSLVFNKDLTQLLPPLIFYFKPPGTMDLVSSVLRKTNNLMYFSPNFTGLNNNFFTVGPVEVYYHDWAGPQFSYNFYGFNESGSPVLGTFYHDVTAGILFTGWMYYPIDGMNGLSTIDMIETTYGIRTNIYILVGVFIPLFTGWGIFHLWRLKKHPEDQYFKLTPMNIAKFFIRLLAWPIFDTAGTFVGLSQMSYFLIDGVGFLLMLFATGIFSIFVLFKFIHIVPGVQHPYGVPLYFIAMISYTLYLLAKHNSSKDEGKKGERNS